MKCLKSLVMMLCGPGFSPSFGYDGWPITDDAVSSWYHVSALEVCAVLLEHADSVRDTLDCFGRTALHYAARGGHAEA